MNSTQSEEWTMSLKGKVAVVTGSGSGIGRGCAIQLARDGATIAVWDLNGDAAAETVKLIEAEGGKAKAYAGDAAAKDSRSEEHTSELQSLMRSSYAVFCLNKKHTHK